MRSQTFRRLVTIGAFLCCPFLVFSQGLYWETTTTIQVAGEHKMESKSYYLPRMFKQLSDKEGTVFRLDKQVIYSIDYGAKEYSEMTFAQLEQVVKQANSKFEAQMAEMKQHLANMPADQRKTMEDMMAKQAPAGGGSKIDVAKTSERKIIGGYSCSKFLLKQNGKEVATVWTTQLPDFSAMQKDFREFNQRLASQMTMIGPQMAEAMQSVEGFPMETTIGGMTATVSKVAKTSIARSEFEIPSGFKKVDAVERKGKRHGGLPDEPANEGDDDQE